MNRVHLVLAILGIPSQKQVMPPRSSGTLTFVMPLLAFLVLSGPLLSKPGNAAPDAPPQSSESLLQEILQRNDHTQKILLYRTLPQFNRQTYREKAQQLFREATATDLQRELAFGMGESDRLEYLPFLLEAFPQAKPEVQEAIAESLGRLGDPQARPLLTSFLEHKSQWGTKPQVTEAVIRAMGRVGADAFTPVFARLAQEAPEKVEMAIVFSHDQRLDRFVAALAWSVGDWKRQATIPANAMRLVQDSYSSQSPYASIAAAKSLAQDGDSGATTYLTTLANGIAIVLPARILAAEALATAYRERSLDKVETTKLHGNALALAMARRIPSEAIPFSTALRWLDSDDEALLAQGALAIAKRGSKENTDVLDRRLGRSSTQIVKLVIAYAWEEIASR